MNEHLTLNNGVRIPPIGFEVFQSAPEETAVAVETALGAGYRHIDTAAGYGNEREVGEGIRRSGVDRADVVERKVWVSDYGFDETPRAFAKSATTLGVEQILPVAWLEQRTGWVGSHDAEHRPLKSVAYSGPAIWPERAVVEKVAGTRERGRPRPDPARSSAHGSL